jgi:hypothetical protein
LVKEAHIFLQPVSHWFGAFHNLLPSGEWAGGIFKQNLGKHHQENIAGKQEIMAQQVGV